MRNSGLPPRPVASRLPLEPADRPLPLPPRRRGGLGFAVVVTGALLAFAVCFAVLLPDALNSAREVAPAGLLGALTATPTPTVTPAPATVTPIPPSSTPAPTATPGPVYLAVGTSGGGPVFLRAAPAADSARLASLPPGTVLRLLGADQTIAGVVWRHVQPPAQPALSGWMMARYLVPATGP